MTRAIDANYDRPLLAASSSRPKDELIGRGRANAAAAAAAATELARRSQKGALARGARVRRVLASAHHALDFSICDGVLIVRNMRWGVVVVARCLD